MPRLSVHRHRAKPGLADVIHGDPDKIADHVRQARGFGPEIIGLMRPRSRCRRSPGRGISCRPPRSGWTGSYSRPHPAACRKSRSSAPSGLCASSSGTGGRSKNESGFISPTGSFPAIARKSPISAEVTGRVLSSERTRSAWRCAQAAPAGEPTLPGFRCRWTT